MDYYFWCLLIPLILIESTAMYIMERSVKNNDNFYILSIFMYGLVAFLFYNIIKKSKKNGCDTNAIWNCSTTLILTLISILAFKNKVSKFKLIGMFAAIVSIFFIEYKN